MIEHLQIDASVAFAYEIAGLSKLCTLLVEDDKVASTVVEINKKLHGKNVNILPLSYTKTQLNEKRSLPKMDNVWSLVNNDWITLKHTSRISPEVKSNIEKVINNTFVKYALVEDYSSAL